MNSNQESLASAGVELILALATDLEFDGFSSWDDRCKTWRFYFWNHYEMANLLEYLYCIALPCWPVLAELSQLAGLVDVVEMQSRPNIIISVSCQTNMSMTKVLQNKSAIERASQNKLAFLKNFEIKSFELNN